MGFFLGRMSSYIDAKKELTNKAELKEVKVDKVYIPITAFGNPEIEILVQVGDRVLRNQAIAKTKGRFIFPLYSSVSGTVVEEVELSHPSSLKKVKHLVIENDGLYETVYKKLDDYKSLDSRQLLNHIKDMGIVGCGGAGFPTYMKYRGVKGIESILVNAVECEPYLTSDYFMTNKNIDDLFVGCEILSKMANCQEVKIAIKKDKKELIEKLENKAKDYSDIHIVSVPNVYPMGWERTLVKQVYNKCYSKLPSEVGVIVNNVSTVIAVAKAVIEGVSILDKVVTVSGEAIKDPANVKALVGTPVKDLITACGGVEGDVVLNAGGPMMGKAMLNDQFVVNPSLNGLTLLKYQKIESNDCLLCGSCVDHCPSGLVPVKIVQAEKAKNIEMIARFKADECVECGLCSYVCPSKLEVKDGVKKAKMALALKK